MNKINIDRRKYVIAFRKKIDDVQLCRSCHDGIEHNTHGDCGYKVCGDGLVFNNEEDIILCTMDECFCEQLYIECGCSCERCIINKRYKYGKQ